MGNLCGKNQDHEKTSRDREIQDKLDVIKEQIDLIFSVERINMKDCDCRKEHNHN